MLENWQEAYLLYVYETQKHHFKNGISLEEYKRLIPDNFFVTNFASIFRVAYQTGYVNGYSHGVHDA